MIVPLALVLSGNPGSIHAKEPVPAAVGVLTVHADEVVRTMDRRRLVGSNICLWHEPDQVYDEVLQAHLRRLKPTFLRIPGGSWSDEYYWNGNGVRDGDIFDTTKRQDGHWEIDFSDYAPGFRIQGAERTLSDYHGVLDVHALHAYVAGHGAEAMVTVNAGTGTPQLAAEWVRWANLHNNHQVHYWEIGNELEGAWELGHFLADGNELTGETYAERFIAFATAMKAVDPTIRIGGAVASNDRGGFTEDLLRLAGEHVDFISFHSYPVEDSLASEADIFARAGSVGPAMDRFHGWIRTYQPDRADDIEIGITEWNMKVIEDRDSADLITGLWTGIWIGEMMRSGVSFAMQWDLLTKTKEGGHGAFFYNGHCLPKSQYWALYLWSRHMGNQLLAQELTGLEHVYAYPTRSGDELRILLVNVDRTREANVRLRIPGFEHADTGQEVRLSHAEYLWDPYGHQPVWSRPPQAHNLAFSAECTVVVPPFSAVVYRVPAKGAKPTVAAKPGTAESPHLEILLPAAAPEDLPIEGWVMVRDKSGRPVPGAIDAAGLVLDGPATSDRYAVPVREAAGRFFLQATGTGPLTVEAQAGALTIKRVIHINPVEERPQIYWRFEDPARAWKVTSSFPLSADDAIRPNQSVAAITLNDVHPDADHDTLLAFEQLPADLPRDRIGGVLFDVHVSPDFTCADPETRISIILQSGSAHWIPIGHVELNELKGKWRSLTFRLPDHNFHSAMHATYALRMQISQPKTNKSPATGRICFDNVGFLLR